MKNEKDLGRTTTYQYGESHLPTETSCEKSVPVVSSDEFERLYIVSSDFLTMPRGPETMVCISEFEDTNVEQD